MLLPPSASILPSTILPGLTVAQALTNMDQQVRARAQSFVRATCGGNAAPGVAGKAPQLYVAPLATRMGCGRGFLTLRAMVPC